MKPLSPSVEYPEHFHFLCNIYAHTKMRNRGVQSAELRYLNVNRHAKFELLCTHHHNLLTDNEAPFQLATHVCGRNQISSSSKRGVK